MLSALTYSNGSFRTFLQGRWLDGHTLNRTYNTGLPGALTVDDNTVPSVFYTDLNLSYDTAWGGKSGASSATSRTCSIALHPRRPP